MAAVNEELINKYKNDPVIIKTYYQAKDHNGKVVNLDGIVNPLKIDNRQLMSPTDDQTRFPSCAGYSACTMIESLYWKNTGKLIELEANQVYANAKLRDGDRNSEGTYLEYALSSALELCGLEMFKNAKIGTFYNNRDLDTIEITKFLLHKFDFIQVGFAIDEGWYYVNNDNYIIRRRGRSLGGHAVNLVGYDQSGVYVLNQWGKSWGSKGFAIMPWDVFLFEFMYGAYIELQK